MSSYTKTIPTENISKIIGIQFSILSPEEILNGSVAKITSKETYIGNKPVIGGIFDPRMGVLESGLICPTDGLNNIQTPGYFGHITLAKPVFYIQYLSTVLKILRCVCFKCSKLLISKEKYKYFLKLSGEERWKYVFSLASKVKRCGEDINDGCGCLRPKKIKKEGLATIIAEWNNEENKEDNEENENIIIKVTPEMVIKIFKRISDEDITFMGFNPIWSRPEWMICQIMAVSPPAVRPSVKHDSQQRSEDDLSHILISIIKTNNTLKEKIKNNAPSNVIDDWTTVLQYYIATQVDNKIPGVASVAQRSGRPFKSIKCRLVGKGGRMRGNLMAKRVDFSARSVITADPNLSIRELGIPLKIAKNITKPEKVNDINKAFLTKLVQNGPNVYPGAKILEKKNGETITLRYIDRKSIILENDDIVHRHMMDGDPVIFNRQPTLHRMSMMCHIAKIMKFGDTFRMNVATTKPYNADFDGDEMNLHMPQDVESESELLNLAAVPYQIISPSNNAPIIGIYQDSMLGSYLFTRNNIYFNKKDAMNILMMADKVNEQNFNVDRDLISNFEILSQIFPPISLKVKNKQYGDNENNKTSNNIVEIINGQYIRGQIDKGILGSGTKGILQRICNDYGNFACSKFIDNFQSIITDYMIKSSFSVGISDLISDNNTKDLIVKIITNKKNEVKNIIEQTQLGIFDNKSGKTNEEEFETIVNNILNQASSEAGKTGLKSLDKNNRFVIMVNAGSKGSELNISQMIACLGQQNVDGKRIPYGFEHRTLPHYNKYDDTPTARGFVENSFINGLLPHELFFHAMGGRVGLIDTAVKTSSTGYIQRRLIKGLEDLMVHYDGTVRSNKDYIIQFAYGEDGIDTVKVENQELQLVNMSIQDIYSHYGITTESLNSKSINSIFLKQVYLKMKREIFETNEKNKKYIDMMINNRSLIIKNVFKNKNELVVRCPVAFSYIINNLLGQQNINSNSLVDLTLLEAYELIEENYKKLEMIYYNSPTELFKTLYFFKLSPKDLLINKRFNKNALVLLLENINLMYKKSIVAPGEMVGMIAAQSLGEPTTQLTLNSVTYETEIVIRDINKKIQKVKIGKFTHDNIELSKKIKYMKDKDTTYAELENYFEVPSCDEDGNVSWKKIEAVTKHPVINEDGTNVMLKVITNEQRVVIATKAKSFLKLINGKLIATNGSQLKVGDYIPVSKKEIDFDENFELNINNILLLNKKEINDIPEKIYLDYDFGYLVGAYVSGGYIKKNYLNIINDDNEYFKPIENLCKLWNIKTEIFEKEILSRKEIKICSSILCKVLVDIIDKSKDNKNFNDKFLYSNKDCLNGFLDAYVGGSSIINEENKTIILKSRSKCILLDIQQILNIFGIYSFIKKFETNKNNVIKEKYYLNIVNNETKKLVNILSLKNSKLSIKKDNLKLTEEEHYHKSNDSYNLIPNEIDGKIIFEIREQHKYTDVVFDRIISIEEVKNTTNYAYDLTVEKTRTFMIWNNLILFDTFHLAGTSTTKTNVTRGVPRIEELLTVSSNPKNPSLTIYLNTDDEDNKEKAKSYMYKIEHTKLEEIVKTTQICFDPDDLNTLIEEDRDMIKQYKTFENMLDECLDEKESINENEKSKWIIRIEMDAETMLEKNITMDDINFTLKNSFSDTINCIYSDYNSEKLIFRIRLNNVIKQSNTKNVFKKNVNPLDQKDQIYILKNFLDNLLQNVVLRGIKGIERVILRKIKDNMIEQEGKFKQKEIWVLDTIGTNLLEVLGLNFIDFTRTFSNDIMETYDVLGIEAVRQIIYNELSEVLESDGTYINYHHMSILVDRMTYVGKIISIFRHGINNDDTGPIAHASFEETAEQFLKAAKHAELDIMKGVSPCVMVGDRGYYGTSSFQTILDIEKFLTLEESTYEDFNSQDYIDKNIRNFENPEDFCSISNIKVENNVSNIRESELGTVDDNYELF